MFDEVDVGRAMEQWTLAGQRTLAEYNPVQSNMQTCNLAIGCLTMTDEYDMIHFHTRLLPVKIESLAQHQIYCKHPDSHPAFVTPAFVTGNGAPPP